MVPCRYGTVLVQFNSCMELGPTRPSAQSTEPSALPVRVAVSEVSEGRSKEALRIRSPDKPSPTTVGRPQAKGLSSPNRWWCVLTAPAPPSNKWGPCDVRSCRSCVSMRRPASHLAILESQRVVAKSQARALQSHVDLGAECHLPVQMRHHSRARSSSDATPKR